MKTLEFPFTSRGFKHELLQRDGLVCLVKRSKPDHCHYEVVKLQIEPAKIMFGKEIPEHEAYPGNEKWGAHGFTYHSTQLDMARKQFHKMLADVLMAREGKDSGKGGKGLLGVYVDL